MYVYYIILLIDPYTVKSSNFCIFSKFYKNFNFPYEKFNIRPTLTNKVKLLAKMVFLHFSKMARIFFLQKM